MTICTFSFSELGIALLKRTAPSDCRQNWLPFQDMYEKRIIMPSPRARRFDKVLRYNTPADYPQPAFILRDAAPKPAALYIVRPDADEAYYRPLHQQAGRSKYLTWRWKLSQNASALTGLHQ